MTVMAYISDSAANVLNVVVAALLFLLAPVIITMAYKNNQRMDKEAQKAPAEEADTDAPAEEESNMQ